MFFEPTSVAEEEDPWPGLPTWYAPPDDEMGAVLVTGLVLARTPNVVVTLPTIEMFSNGCLMNVNIAMRRTTMTSEELENLQRALFSFAATEVRGRLPDDLLRFGVRYADGTMATTVGQHPSVSRVPRDPPSCPRLSRLFGGISVRSGDDSGGFVPMGLWLWPLPPRETFEFAVEWPTGGVELCIVKLDGAAIAAGAQQSLPHWPDSAENQ